MGYKAWKEPKKASQRLSMTFFVTRIGPVSQTWEWLSLLTLKFRGSSVGIGLSHSFEILVSHFSPPPFSPSHVGICRRPSCSRVRTAGHANSLRASILCLYGTVDGALSDAGEKVQFVAAGFDSSLPSTSKGSMGTGSFLSSPRIVLWWCLCMPVDGPCPVGGDGNTFHWDSSLSNLASRDVKVFKIWTRVLSFLQEVRGTIKPCREIRHLCVTSDWKRECATHLAGLGSR